MMNTLSLNHFSIRTLEIEKTTIFFTQLLGLTVGPRPEFPFPGVWLYNGSHDDWSNSVLHLIAIDKNNPTGLQQYLGDRDPLTLKGSGAVDHIAFFATGLEEKLKQIKALALPYQERTVPVIQLHQIFLEDPNGIIIELNYPAHEKAALDSNA
jgi:catechol 2,3-dioxygenase-like lactoylglutathione lyase family enzyme